MTVITENGYNWWQLVCGKFRQYERLLHTLKEKKVSYLSFRAVPARVWRPAPAWPAGHHPGLLLVLPCLVPDIPVPVWLPSDDNSSCCCVTCKLSPRATCSCELWLILILAINVFISCLDIYFLKRQHSWIATEMICWQFWASLKCQIYINNFSLYPPVHFLGCILIYYREKKQIMQENIRLGVTSSLVS